MNVPFALVYSGQWFASDTSQNATVQKNGIPVPAAMKEYRYATLDFIKHHVER
jgi:hypothetical protein